MHKEDDAEKEHGQATTDSREGSEGVQVVGGDGVGAIQRRLQEEKHSHKSHSTEI